MERKNTKEALKHMGFARYIENLLRPYDKRSCPSCNSTIEIGIFGERVAERYLGRLGYKCLVRNYQSRWGEIDLTCRDGDTLVFVEVKARNEEGWGTPGEAVTESKRRRLIRTAYAYLSELRDDRMKTRFDVVEVYLRPGGKPRCHLIRDAFPLMRYRE